MGATTSREAARRLPKQVKSENLSKPTASPSTIHDDYKQAAAAPDAPLPEEEEEQRDPELHKKLTKIGPVKVEPTVTRMRTSDNMLHIIRERQRIEEDEDLGRLSQVPNRTTIDVIFSALEQRKRLAPGDLNNEKVLQGLSRDYGLDVPTLQSLYKYYNTMAVLPARPDDQKNRKYGIWAENKQEWQQALDTAIARNEEIKQKIRVEKSETAATIGSSSGKKEQAERTLTDAEKKEKRLQDLFED
ncbi:hypothetical protein BDB00DRAFT_786909 [Zychaea mexicana]|uniref:uncharacterized protein n=1 Tax=Zychaea mexicana TaxID=64656 RepID=UPI0022FE802B|nr:uncharacterized protein BDB00DRAFT_786909 [Zychaea mexicana]KAI9494804.1 hypothetical protein BDB00DRAFT_786909 [Zychaea mexicana]